MPLDMLLQSLQQLPGENHGIPILSPLAVAAADMTVLERQIARLQWQQQQSQLPQQQQSYYAATIASDASLPHTPYSIPQPPHLLPSCSATNFSGEQEMISHDLSSGSAGVWPDLTHYPMLCDAIPGGGFVGGGAGAFLRAFSSLPAVGDVESKGRPSPPASQLGHASIPKDSAAAAAVASPSTDRVRESSKKRKSAEKAGTHKPEEVDRGKKMVKVENADAPVEPQLDSPSIMSSSTAITSNTDNHKKNNCKDNNREASSTTSKENSEPPPKTDYIHVRARRGQATDSHSLAERVRREKISERMKLLQDLVPGCKKITGKAGMLDEIINYVQSLQRQVEFLSMRLAAVTPALDFNLDALFAKEMSILAGGSGIPAQMGLPPELLSLSFLQFNPLQQQAMAAAAATAAECGSLPVPMVSSCSAVDAALHGIAAATEPCSFADSCNILVQPPPSTTSGWEGDLQRFYSFMEEFEQGRPAVSVPADAAVAPSSTFQPLVNAR